MEPTTERPRRRGPQKPPTKAVAPPTASSEDSESEELMDTPAEIEPMTDDQMRASMAENEAERKRPARDMRWMAQLRDRGNGQDALFDFGTKGELNTFLRENPNLYIVGDRVIRGYFKPVKVQTQARF